MPFLPPNQQRQSTGGKREDIVRMFCVNSAVLREAVVARQRNAEYGYGNLRDGRDVDM